MVHHNVIIYWPFRFLIFHHYKLCYSVNNLLTHKSILLYIIIYLNTWIYQNVFKHTWCSTDADATKMFLHMPLLHSPFVILSLKSNNTICIAHYVCLKWPAFRLFPHSNFLPQITNHCISKTPTATRSFSE